MDRVELLRHDIGEAGIVVREFDTVDEPATLAGVVAGVEGNELAFLDGYDIGREADACRGNDDGAEADGCRGGTKEVVAIVGINGVNGVACGGNDDGVAMLVAVEAGVLSGGIPIEVRHVAVDDECVTAVGTTMRGGDGDGWGFEFGEREAYDAVATANGAQGVGIVAALDIRGAVVDILCADAEGVDDYAIGGVVDREVETDKAVAARMVGKYGGRCIGAFAIGYAIDPYEAVADGEAVGGRVAGVDGEIECVGAGATIDVEVFVAILSAGVIDGAVPSIDVAGRDDEGLVAGGQHGEE